MSKKNGESGNSLDSSVALDTASVPADLALREILDSSQHIIYRANFVSGGYDYVSTAATALLGVSLEELQQRGMEILQTRMPPEDWSRCVTHFEELARANPGKSTRTLVEYRLRLIDGGTAWFSDSAIADADAAGKLLAVHGITTDINEKKRAQAALEEKTRLLEDFFSQSIDGCFVLRFDQPMAAPSIASHGTEAAIFALHFLRVNEAFAQQFGSHAELIVGQRVDALPAMRPLEFSAALMRCLESGNSLATIELQPRDGVPVWVEMQLLTDLDAEKQVLGIFGVQRDISDRVRQDLALRESEEKYSATMKSAKVGIFMLQNQKFIFVNPTLAAYFGYTEEDLLVRVGPLDLIVPDEHEWLIDQMRRREAGEPGFPYELTGVRKDGSRFPMAVMGVPAQFQGKPASVGTVFDLSAQRLVEDEIVASRNRYRALFESAQDAIIVIDGTAGVLVDANVEAELLFRRPREELLGLPSARIFPPDRQARHESELQRHIAAGGGEPEEMRVRNADGVDIPVEVSTSVVEAEGGRKLLQAILRDISARRTAEEGLRLAQRVLDVTEEVILITDAERRIIAINPAFTRVTGFAAEDVVGKTPRFLKSERQTPEFYTAMWETVDRAGVWQGELWNRRKNGELFPAWLTISVYRDIEGKIINYVGISSDISERHAAEARIRELAYFDPLTHLPNRTLLHDRVEQVLAKAEREGGVAALLFIDLDHFKTINDSLGHFTGDQILCQVAERMAECVRRTDTVSRLGGDEFVIVAAESSIEGAAGVARKILDKVSKPYFIDTHELSVTPSIGISLYPQDGRDFETLLKHADTAMYRAKESGRNAYQFFAAEMNVAALERLMLENSMRVGLERREFVLYYQPQIELVSGRIIGAEALIRWQHPQIGMISPAKFIPVAEACGLIVPLGAWVLKEACRQAVAWQLADLPPLCVAVNISSAQFRQQQFEEVVAGVLKSAGLAPEYLELELTESIVMENAEATIETLGRLSAMGVQLAIDDFGTGYSSLSYLKRFPIDKLKIDQSFVRDIVTDSDDWAIARTVISMGQSLRLHVIAEGVETADQLEMLYGQGCNAVQGYHFSVPLPAGAFAEMLAKQPFLTKDECKP